MRIESKKYLGCAVEIDLEDRGLIFLNEKGEVLLKISVDELLDRIIAEKNESYGNRREPRVNAALQLRFKDPNGKLYDGMTGTIGTGGLFLESDHLYPVGSPLELEIKFPHEPDEPIRAVGEVVWNRARMERTIHFPGMGIKFSRISEEDKERLQGFVRVLTRAKRAGETQ
jgi:type IV pilus assembly protein PilZ